jgi:hypothetical protein
MFIGHYGVGLAAKKPAPAISLGTLILAAQWLDLIWPILLLLNIEHVTIHPGDTSTTPLDFDYYPFSHSLLFVLAWSIVLGVVYYLIKKNKKNALIVGILVLSHWVLDLIVHRPDLPIMPNGPDVGFGLWNSVIATIIVEGAIFIAGSIIYLKQTKARDNIGKISLWSLLIFLAVVYILNLFGPTPTDTTAIKFAGLSTWIFVLWGYWIDKHRIVV